MMNYFETPVIVHVPSLNGHYWAVGKEVNSTSVLWIIKVGDKTKLMSDSNIKQITKLGMKITMEEFLLSISTKDTSELEN